MILDKRDWKLHPRFSTKRINIDGLQIIMDGSMMGRKSSTIYKSLTRIIWMLHRNNLWTNQKIIVGKLMDLESMSSMSMMMIMTNKIIVSWLC